MENLGKSLAVEWAADGVRVNSVAPGVVTSPTAKANYESDVLEMGKPGIPAKRLGVTQEVLILFQHPSFCPFCPFCHNPHRSPPQSASCSPQEQASSGGQQVTLPLNLCSVGRPCVWTQAAACTLPSCGRYRSMATCRSIPGTPTTASRRPNCDLHKYTHLQYDTL